MKIYTSKKEIKGDKLIIADDMILTKDLPTTAGSKMLEGYLSLFDAEVLTKLYSKGYSLLGKTAVGEFAIDLLGETADTGAIVKDGVIFNATAEAIKADGVKGAICLDVNGSVRRSAAQSGLCAIKATYGTVSRYGTIPVVCSGETVSVMADTVDNAKILLDDIVGHDDKDGTSLSNEMCDKIKSGADFKKVEKVALLKSMLEGVDGEVKEKIDSAVNSLKSNGVEVVEIDDEIIKLSNLAWNVLMSAELCNNVSRYDGVKYGYRTKKFTNVYEIYTNSRTEAFKELLKTVILYGSEALSTENYFKVYDKCLRMRRVIKEEFEKIFSSFDAVLMPACSRTTYTEEEIKANKYLSIEENFYTAPASITGLPTVVTAGVQLVGNAFSENALCDLAKKL